MPEPDKAGMVVSHLKTMFSSSTPTKKDLEEVIAKMSQMLGGLSTEEQTQIIRDFNVQRDIRLTEGDIILGKERDFVRWYPGAKKDIDPYFSDRYLEYLRYQLNFEPDVVNGINKVTDKICGLLGNPHLDTPWDRRGMVVGNVQSGKTANYTGVVCKAADAGYKLIVIIAGIHNNLRKQTQERIDAGFLGFDTSPSESAPLIGVGLLRHQEETRPIPLTNTGSDFDAKAQSTSMLGVAQMKGAGVFVIKKNTHTLKNLIKWIDKQNKRSEIGGLNRFPLLLIDDEADNASINTSKDPDKATTINRLIRTLLNKFEKSTYVGYTATPFANIFIAPDDEGEAHPDWGEDLFPRDFVYALDSPTNYLGADRLFGVDADLDDSITTVDDHVDVLPLKHKKTDPVTELPSSLWRAVECFIIGRAIRLLRGHSDKHMSMLVNVSRFTNVQITIRNLIHAELGRYQEAIRYRQSLPLYESLKKTWRNQGFAVMEPDWSRIEKVLLEAVSSIEVLAINSQSDDALNYSDYPSGRSVIAVGGFSLSRGLTLEGLMVSYLLRNTKMYDTLLQMGRWFGYRPGYEALCRLYLTEESKGWYQFITEASRELRLEIKRMVKSELTPRDFGMKVRKAPKSLLITARNKMRHSQEIPVQVGLAGHFIETTRVFGATEYSREESDTNFDAAAQLIVYAKEYCQTDPPEEVETLKYHFWQAVPVTGVQRFLRTFKNHEASTLTQTKPLMEFIDRRDNGELEFWDVAINRNGDGQSLIPSQRLDLDFQCARRTLGSHSDLKKSAVFIGNKHRVGDARMEKLGLKLSQIGAVETRWKSSETYQSSKAKRPPAVPGQYWRMDRARPLLILHAIEMVEPNPKVNGKKKYSQPRPVEGLEPVLAYSISFPTFGPHSALSGKTVTYKVNTTWMRKQGFVDEDEDEE